MNTQKKNLITVLGSMVIGGILFISEGVCFERNSWMEGVRFEEYQNGNKILQVSAERAYLANHRLGFFQVALKKVFYLENANVILFNAQGNQSSSISTPLAILDPEDKSLYDANGENLH